MSRRYDSRTTIFSPEGRLYQVEYAMEAISHAGLAIGLLATDGIVLVAEKKVVSPLLEPIQPSHEKIYKIDSHITVSVSGITSDANILVQQARLMAQQHFRTFGEPIPVELLVQKLCDIKQGYTQFGGLRPFGVSMIFAGYDEHYGLQLYHSDPSGNYGGWKAISMGSNSSAVQSILKEEYSQECNVSQARDLAVRVLKKSIEGTLGGRVEICIIQRQDQELVMHHFTRQEIASLIGEETLGEPASSVESFPTMVS